MIELNKLGCVPDRDGEIITFSFFGGGKEGEMNTGARRKLAENIVGRIVYDLTDRGGLQNEWDSIDPEIRTEILEAWILETLAAMEEAKVQ